jgi:hypothetical protein
MQSDFDADLFVRCLQAELQQSFSCLTLMSRAKHWCFTLNNYTDDSIEFIASNADCFEYLIYGKEVGESGTPHLQGFVSFKSRVRRNHCVEKIGQAHFTVARHVDNSIEYCKKDSDYTEFGVRSLGRTAGRTDLDDFKKAVLNGCTDMKVIRNDFSEVVAKYPKFVSDFVNDHMPTRNIEFHPLREWQESLYGELILPPNKRTIYFVIDTVGNAGKSWFAHYYCHIHDNGQVLLPGKKADMSYALHVSTRVLFVDAPRSKQGDFIQYDFLEDVKNGYIFSSKYESRMKTIGDCHVVVLMNEQPDMSKLSADRYKIIKVA